MTIHSHSQSDTLHRGESASQDACDAHSNNSVQQNRTNTIKSTTTIRVSSGSRRCARRVSNKGGEACAGGLSTAQAAGGPVQGAVLTERFRRQQGGGGSPAAFRPEQSALALGLWCGGALRQQRGQGGHRRRVWSGLLLHQRLRLGVPVRRGPRHSFLLTPP